MKNPTTASTTNSTFKYGRDNPMFGPDFWPYGIEGSRKTLEAFTQYAFEQGVCHRKLSVEEIFVPETLKSYRV